MKVLESLMKSYEVSWSPLKFLGISRSPLNSYAVLKSLMKFLEVFWKSLRNLKSLLLKSLGVFRSLEVRCFPLGFNWVEEKEFCLHLSFFVFLIKDMTREDNWFQQEIWTSNIKNDKRRKRYCSVDKNSK